MKNKIVLNPIYITAFLSACIFVAQPVFVSENQTSQIASTNLPKVWQIVFADAASVNNFQKLRADGFDGLFKCAAYAPSFPNQPISAGAEWRLVEQVEGHYDWTSLDLCLESARQTNMWFIPEIVINVPPIWFVSKFPNSLLKDSRGLTATNPDDNGAPYLLSPWFIKSGVADTYISKFINSFLAEISKYPNVPAVMIGNFKLNVLPWKMGMNNGDNFVYWPIWDDFAKSDYISQFGAGNLPPSTWSDYDTRNENDKNAFRDWLTSVFSDNLKNKYIPWLSGFTGWKVINSSIWDNNGVRASIFTTTTPDMVAAKQNAIASTGETKVIINDDNMGDYGLEAFQLQDVQLAHGNGFLIFGEKVPGLPSWSNLFSMWQTIKPDGFINISSYDTGWIGQFRGYYGIESKPFPFSSFLPVLKK